MNLYAYVGNDPVNWVDPNGETRRSNSKKGLAAANLIARGVAAVTPEGSAVNNYADSVVQATETGLTGKTKAASSGVTKKTLPEHTKHSLNQKINRQVKTSDELGAIRNPLDKRSVKYDSQGRPSQRYVGEKAEVAINPDTNKIVSVNPTSSKKAARLKRRNERNQ